MDFRAFNPATGAFLYSLAPITPVASEVLLARIDAEQRDWRVVSVANRCAFVTALGAVLRARRDTLANALVQEMGKPISAARAEVDKCAALCEIAPSIAMRALADDQPVSDNRVSVRVRYEPLGCVLAIMPWNFPYWQALRFAVPTLLAGNGVLIKPATSVPGPAHLLDQCVQEARAVVSGGTLPPAPLHTAMLALDVIDDVIGDPRIVGVTLTGSDRAGRHVAQVAGKHLKKVVLELGGSDPFLVLPSAHVARAAQMAVTARTVNTGQSCVAAKRFIVCEEVYEEFTALFLAGMRALVVGDPSDEQTQVGPLATAAIRDGLRVQVQRSMEYGAVRLLGDDSDRGPGYFFPPTVLVNIPEHAPAACEELFGPVAAVFRVPDTAAALACANRSPFGLGASVWTTDPAEAQHCAQVLDVGMVFVNDIVVSDARFPFGGVKQSGVGRELGLAGFREFTNQKTVAIRHA